MQNLIWKIAGTVAAVAAASAAVVFVDKLMQKQQDKIDELIRNNPETEPEVPQQPEQEAETRVYCAVPQPVGADVPNPNPVMAKPIETPRTEDGKIDVSRLCDPADFCDWDDLGCQS